TKSPDLPWVRARVRSQDLALSVRLRFLQGVDTPVPVEGNARRSDHSSEGEGAAVTLYGLACPSCSRRGLMRVARFLYRCLPCDQDFELPFLLHRIMEGSGTTAKDGPPIQPERHHTHAPRLSLVHTQHPTPPPRAADC